MNNFISLTEYGVIGGDNGTKSGFLERLSLLSPPPCCRSRVKHRLPVLQYVNSLTTGHRNDEVISRNISPEGGKATPKKSVRER